MPSSPELLQEEAELALQDGSWTLEMFWGFIRNLTQAAKKSPNPHRLTYDFYPKGNYAGATLILDLPKAQNEIITLTLKNDATIMDDDDGCVGLGGEVVLTLDKNTLNKLANFLAKAAARIDDLPSETDL